MGAYDGDLAGRNDVRLHSLGDGFLLAIARDGPVAVCRDNHILGQDVCDRPLLLAGLEAYSQHLRDVGRPGVVKAKFLVTGLCNQRCYYCSASSNWYTPGLPTGSVEGILSQLRNSGVILLQWHGGEASVRADFPDLLRLGDSLGFYVDFFTNGSSLVWRRPQVFDVLRTLNAPPLVIVSLLSPTEADHDRLAHRRGAFHRALDTVKRLRDVGCPVRLEIALTKETVGQLGRARSLAEELNVCLAINTELFNGGVEVSSYAVTTRDILRARRDVLGDEEVRLGNYECAAGRMCITVSHDGDVVACERNMAVSFGSLLEASLADIVASEGYQSYMRNTYARPASCSSCPRDLYQYCYWCPAEPLNLGLPVSEWQKYHCQVAARRRLFWTGRSGIEDAQTYRHGPRVDTAII